MTRSILAALASTAAVVILVGTGGCNSTGVGDPCTPEAEYSQAFLGFNVAEVNVESKSFQCETRLCLAHHFQGRVTCPYGQDSTGAPTSPAKACATENGNPYGCCTPISQAVDGIDTTLTPPGYDSKTVGATVQPQCVDRTAKKAVYCSCRCQNVDGRTDDGANYCTCPTGFSCTQIISSIGATEAGLTGAYCIIKGTDYNPGSGCQAPCDPSAGNCGTAQGVQGH